MKLWLDLETYSDDDLKEVGTYVYAESADILLFAYAVDEGPVTVWDCTAEDAPRELLSALRDATEVWAANAQFDKAILAGPAGAHLPRIELTRWRCSMAQALSHRRAAAQCFAEAGDRRSQTHQLSMVGSVYNKVGCHAEAVEVLRPAREAAQQLGIANVLASLQRKSKQADRMFDALLHRMTDALRIQRHTDHTARIEVPSWLAS